MTSSSLVCSTFLIKYFHTPLHSNYCKLIIENKKAAEREYAVNEARAAALAEGRAEGRVEGQYETNLDVAKKLKKAGADIALISQCSGLSVEEINAL